MKQLVAEREAQDSPQSKETNEYHAGKVLDQEDKPLDSHADLSESYCLLCKRRTAVAACMPCGHLCICEVCQKERAAQLKKCPQCKNDITGAVNILGE